MTNTKDRKPLAFISCSLRNEDRKSIEWVESVVRQLGFEPYGTVGRFDAAPASIPELMKENIKKSDCIIIVGTSRYFQEDVHCKERTGKGISELIHVEVGMAFSENKPVLAFVFNDTNIGSFLPMITQYIRINAGENKLSYEKQNLIKQLFTNAYQLIQKNWEKKNQTDLQNAGGFILKIIGGIAAFNLLFSDDEKPVPKKRATAAKRKVPQKTKY